MKLSTTLPAASLLILALCAGPTPVATSQQVNKDDKTFAIQFDEVEGTPLTDFIKYTQIETGKQISYDPAEVKDVRIRALGEAVMPRSEFRKFAESTLMAYGFLLVPYGDTLHLVSTRGGGFGGAKPGYLKSMATFVPPDQLEEYDGRWVVITTSLPLENVNVLEAVNMLQTYFTDPMVESVRAISRTNSIVATGYPQTLLNAKRLLAELDRKLEPNSDSASPDRLTLLEGRIMALEAKVAALEGN